MTFPPFPPPTPRQARALWFSLTALSVAVSLALAGLLLWGVGRVLKELSGVLFPMVAALVLAYILDPVVEFLVRKKIPRLWAILLVFLMAVLLAAGLIGSVVPDVIRETRKLIDDLPRDYTQLSARIEHFAETSRVGKKLGFLLRLSRNENTNAVPAVPTIPDANAAPNPGLNPTNAVETSMDTEALKKALDAPLSETIMPGLARAAVFILKWITAQLSKVTTWVEFLIGFFLVPFYLFYFLLEKRGINRRWTDYLPINESKAKDEVVFVLQAINDCLIVFFRGQVLVALCVGVLLTIGYLALGLNYALLIGAVACVVGIVPYLGAALTLVLALTVAAIQFGDWLHPLLVLCIAGTVKLIEDFVLSPKIIGDRSGLHPLAIVIALMIGTTLFGGILGGMLAIPLTATLRTLMFRYVWKTRPEEIKAGSD